MYDEFLLPQATATTVGYAWGGSECEHESENCLAKKMDFAGKNFFFVRFATSGPCNGFMWDPNAMAFQAFAKSDFRPVTANQFEAYLLFLTNHNPGHLRQAERA